MKTIEEINKEARREERDFFLKENVDSMNPMRWESMTTEKQDLWRSYRQALLDISTQEGFPFTVSWPEKPE